MEEKETIMIMFLFSSRRRHTRSKRDWSSDVCSSDLNANGRVGVADEPLRVGRRECAELVERAQGNDDGGWFGVFIGKQFAQNFLCFLKRIGSMNLPLNRPPVTFSPIGGEGWDEGVSAAFNQQTLRGLSSPEERAGAFAGESLRIERAHVGGGSARCVAVGEAINAAAVVAGIDAVLLLKMTRNGRVILDDLAVVVGDPDRTI